MARLSSFILGLALLQVVFYSLLMSQGIYSFCVSCNVTICFLIADLVIIMRIPVLWMRNRVLIPLDYVIIHSNMLEISRLHAKTASILNSRVNINSFRPRN